MKNKAKITTCLSFTEKLIKLAQANAGGEILSLASVSIVDKTEEGMSRSLEALLSAGKVKTLGRLVLMVPRYQATLHYVRLPSTRPDELSQMARLQAAKQIPYDPKEIIFAHQLIRENPDGYSDVVLIIMHQDVVKKHLKALKKNKIEPEEIILDVQGMCRWFEFQPELKSESPAMVVDLDGEYARIDIISFRGPALLEAAGESARNRMPSAGFIYSRAFSLVLSPVEYKIRLGEEINRSLSAYEKEKIGLRPRSAVFTGADEALKYIDEDFLGSLGLKAVRYAQGKNIRMGASSEVKPKDLQGSSFAGLFGVVLSDQAYSFSLIPEDIIQGRNNAVYKYEISKTIVLSILIILTIISGMFLNVRERKKVISNLSRELDSLSGDVSRVENKLKKISYVKNQFQGGSCLDILAEVFRLSAEDINLSLFSYSFDNSLVLKGQAKSLSGVFNLVNILEKSPVLKDVQLRHSFERKIQEEKAVDFDILCRLEKQ